MHNRSPIYGWHASACSQLLWDFYSSGLPTQTRLYQNCPGTLNNTEKGPPLVNV